MKPVRTAVVQNSAVVFNREATLEKTARLVKGAKLQGAELVLFPEAFISAADLDMNEIAREKYDFDVTGHDSRPDIFQLRVN